MSEDSINKRKSSNYRLPENDMNKWLALTKEKGTSAQKVLENFIYDLLNENNKELRDKYLKK